ncbi:hypothetical protein Bca52824_011276 [Brassica carinata]|uniref:Uncharacterized protein n=1 Tax=Brassica carinata TaxID=52824 RepID=A0A8X7WCY0_BRACI|nr:hypothetical protein Bca52824_011276 [Brassica carinata]
MVQDTSQGSMTVTQYRSFFYNLEIVQRLDEQALISVAKAGLKEEIRQGLMETISTLDALFKEATEFEEILKTEKTSQQPSQTPPQQPRPRQTCSQGGQERGPGR